MENGTVFTQNSKFKHAQSYEKVELFKGNLAFCNFCWSRELNYLAEWKLMNVNIKIFPEFVLCKYIRL